MERPINPNPPEHESHGDKSPADRRLRAEIIERLPETPDKASQRAIEVIGAMMSSCVRAHSAGRPLLEDDARGIAHFLALSVDQGRALQRFADGDVLPVSEVRAEYLEIARRPNVYPETRAVIDWLGNYLLSASYPEIEPARPDNSKDWQHAITFKEDLALTLAFHLRGPEQDPREDETLMTRIERFALDHGAAGVAFLRLPTTDASRTDLDALFARAHINSYESVDALLATHFRLFRIEDDQPLTPIPFTDLSAALREELYARAGQHLAVIEVAGQVHAFHRHVIEPPQPHREDEKPAHERDR